VEPRSVPVIAGEVDVDAAVGRFAADVAADVTQGEAAVLRVEGRGAVEVLDRDAAVVGGEGEHRGARHVELEADVPAAGASGVGTVGADATAAGVDAHARDEAARLGVGVGV